MDYPVTLTRDDNGTVLVTFPDVDGLAMTHGSKLAQFEAAFGALGKRLVVGVEDVAAVRKRRRAKSTPKRRWRAA